MFPICNSSLLEMASTLEACGMVDLPGRETIRYRRTVSSEKGISFFQITLLTWALHRLGYDSFRLSYVLVLRLPLR